MEPDESWGVNQDGGNYRGGMGMMEKDVLKPLERRKMTHQRSQAHSLVGTPNYIAPEVLQRAGT